VIRNIIFDWSGTLVNDLPAVLEATNYVLKQAGCPEMTLEEFRAEFCLPFARFYERYTPHIEMAQLEEWFHFGFRRSQQSVLELPHARAFLEFCRAQSLRTFVLSTVRRDYFEAQSTSCGFHQFIDRAYLEIRNKQEQIHQLLQENELQPHETLFIGDMQHDIDTARHGGIWSCGVLTGYNTLKQLRASEPDLIVEHLGELKFILEQNGLHLKHAQGSPALSQPMGELHQHRPISTVGALIYNSAGEVLMVRTPKWSNRWGIPGGKIKFGETSIQALQREIREETRLEIFDIQFVLVQDCIHSKEFYRDEHFILLNYTCRTKSLDVKLNEEAVEFRWVAPEQAHKMDVNHPTRILLEAVMKR
jgi:phosphoglycolate phosphatase